MSVDITPINPSLIINGCTGIVEKALKTKSREFNRTLFRMEDDQSMIVLIKLCLMSKNTESIQDILQNVNYLIAPEGKLSESKAHDLEIILRNFILDATHVPKQIYNINLEIRNNGHNQYTIGIIHVLGILDSPATKPKYVFSSLIYEMDTVNKNRSSWLLLVDYSKLVDKRNDPTEKTVESKSKLAILSNKTGIFYKQDEVDNLLRKYKIDTQDWNKTHPEPIHRKYSKTPLAAGKISRLKHAVGKRVHKVMKRVDRARNKTVSLSKSKGTFTRIRVEPEKNAKEVMTLMKSKYPNVLADPQSASTNWGRFRDHVGWLTKQERAKKQYSALSKYLPRERDKQDQNDEL